MTNPAEQDKLASEAEVEATQAPASAAPKQSAPSSKNAGRGNAMKSVLVRPCAPAAIPGAVLHSARDYLPR